MLFQFTPLREGRLETVEDIANELKFQFTPLREGRLLIPANRAYQPKFQFTPLREGRPVSLWYQVKSKNFNSRPYVRGDASIPGQSGQRTISIHAPT